MMALMQRPSEIMAAEVRRGGETHKVLDIAAGINRPVVAYRETRERSAQSTGFLLGKALHCLAKFQAGDCVEIVAH